MAGLLDIFGTGGVDTMGLLGMSPEDIKRSRDDAQAQALYALAGRLFQGGNTGASIAQGLQQGQQAYKGAMQGSLQDQMQMYQLQELKKKRELEQQALMRQQGVENLITKAYRPETFAETPLTNIMGQEIAGPNQPQAAGLGMAELAPKLMATKEGRSALAELVSAQKAMAGETFKLGEGEKQYQRDFITGEIKEVAAGAPKTKELKYQDIGNAIVALDANGKEVSRITKGRAPEGPVSFQTIETDQGLMAFNPRTLQMTPVMGADGKPITKTGKPTETETNAAGFASRMVAANQITSKLATGAQPKTAEAVLSAIPLIGSKIPEIIPEGVGGLSPERRQYLQAANNFIRANLRKESGAAIGAQEEENEFRTYFPVVGDSPAVLAQKAQARKLATDGMIQSAGNAFKMPELPKPAEKPILRWNPRTNSFEAS